MIERDPAPGEWASLAATALEYANDAVMVCDFEPARMRLTIRYVNAAFEEQTGYTRAEALGRGLDLLYGPLTDRSVVAELTAAVAAMQPIVAEIRKYRKDGTPFWAEISGRPVAGDDGKNFLVLLQRDVTERIETEAELALLSAALDYANDGIAMFRWDHERNLWHFRHVNEMFLKMTGYEIGELIGETSDKLFGERTDADLLRTFRVKLLAGEPVRGEFALYRKDGTYFWTDLNGRGLRDERGVVADTIIVYRDVTEKRLHEERLSFEAAHDPLTGIFNRRYFVRTLEALLADVRHVSHALLFFDLDGFKPINDTHGHEAGDRLLLELVSSLGASLRRGDVFARLGGDEFGILLFGCEPARSAAIAGDVLSLVREFTLLWEGHTLRVGASIGVVEIGLDAASAADVMRRADDACYAAKNTGRNRVVVA
ncbi:MAG TPA: diguanylate cyclase [Verrucomicrobiae bacterium]|nr:diguanylate cyclase [Verrucomicrobiae bacterium]